jgi:RND family efflux transporter MFP subunit
MPSPLLRFSAGLVMAAALSACGPAGQDAAQPGQGQPQAIPVQVAQPLREQVADWDEFTGRFESTASVQVRARVTGYVEEVRFTDGQMVEEGEVLFVIDSRPFEAALAAAEGQRAQARAELAQAETDFARAERLRASDAISEEELEQRRTGQAAGQAALASAEANVRAARLDLDFTEVTAPISGRVSARNVDPGNLVAGGSSQGDVLTTIVSDDPLYFTFNASESTWLRYQRGQGTGAGAPVEVRLQDEAEFSRTGEIVFADNQIAGQSGTIRMRAQIANEDGFIRPGMLGEVRVRGSSPYQALLVPQTAVQTDGARRLIYVVNADNEVEARAVRLGPVSGNLRVVQQGLEPTDRVIVNGAIRVQPGTPVQPQDAVIERDPDAPSTLRIQTQPAASARPAN